MKRRTIFFIIALMSISLFGIAVIQFYWIKWSVSLDEIRFNNNVMIALDRTRNDILEDVQSTYETLANLKKLKQDNSNYRKTDIEPLVKKMNLGLSSPWKNPSYFKERLDVQDYLNSSLILDDLEPKKIGGFLQRELQSVGINLKYDYGISSYAENAFIIINDNHVVSIKGEDFSDIGVTNNGLYNTNHKIKIFGKGIEAPGELKIYFYNQSQHLWLSAWKALSWSLLFTALILFCFIFTIYIILHQKKVSEMKTDFINNMTHEFKTPIATISLAADSIINPVIIGSAEKVRRFSDIIKQENKRMLSQVEKVLQMAVLDKEDFQLKYADINMHDAITQAVNSSSLKIKKIGSTAITKLNASNYNIEGDQTHVSNVIYNLLDNAIKYSNDDVEIEVRTWDNGKYLNIEVKDNGIGMTKEALNSIFNKFYRVHTGNLHDVKGFGLGLSYVKTIMNAHNGLIEVKSELGKGSRFILSFPYKKSD